MKNPVFVPLVRLEEGPVPAGGTRVLELPHRKRGGVGDESELLSLQMEAGEQDACCLRARSAGVA